MKTEVYELVEKMNMHIEVIAKCDQSRILRESKLNDFKGE